MRFVDGSAEKAELSKLRQLTKWRFRMLNGGGFAMLNSGGLGRLTGGGLDANTQKPY
jgi:hypothetical protein